MLVDDMVVQQVSEELLFEYRQMRAQELTSDVGIRCTISLATLCDSQLKEMVEQHVRVACD